MGMKKSELKEILMPIVKECVEQVINERIMASIVKEVAAGVVQGMTVLTEQKRQKFESSPRAIYEAVEDMHTPTPAQEDPDKYRIPKYGEKDPYAEKKAIAKAQEAAAAKNRLIESLGGRNSVYGEMFASADVTDESIQSDLVAEQILNASTESLAKSGLNPENVGALTSEGTSLDVINALMGR